MSSQKCRSITKKTQPTLNSSFRQTNTTKRMFHLLINTNCPQTSDFKINQPYSQSKSREKVYVHNLQIDYGRLQKPSNSCNEGNKEVKFIKINETKTQQYKIEERIQTKRITGISSFVEKNLIEDKNTEKKRQHGIKISINLQRTEPKRNSSLQNYLPICRSLSKSKIRLQEVRAYDNALRNQNSKKKLHSRIVKMVVAGGSKKTKIITYPDKKDYQRLYCNK